MVLRAPALIQNYLLRSLKLNFAKFANHGSLQLLASFAMAPNGMGSVIACGAKMTEPIVTHFNQLITTNSYYGKIVLIQ